MLEVELRAVRPMHVRYGYDRSVLVYCIHQRIIPAGATLFDGQRRYRSQVRFALRGELAPRIHVAGKLLASDYDVLARAARQIARSNCNTVGNGGNDRDAIGITDVDQLREKSPRLT
jgi:hypothetical protein